jgi:lysophospholipase L1-like esterase
MKTTPTVAYIILKSAWRTVLLRSALIALLLAPLAPLAALPAAEPSASIPPVKRSADGRRMQIMPMGDSITQGTGTGNCGYRNTLYQILKNSGCVFDFVGRKNVPGDITPDTDHWGRAGWQMSGTPGTVDGKSYVSLQGENRSGLFEEMKDAISPAYFSSSADVRNVLLLMIGVNDLLHQVVDSTRGRFKSDTNKDGQGDGKDAIADGLIARLQALLADINMRAAKHHLHIEVMVGTIPKLSKKWKGDAVSDVIVHQGLQYNQWIRTQLPAVTFPQLTIKVVDMEGPLNGKLADGVHPNADGYEAMAHAWHEVITGVASLPAALPSASIHLRTTSP